MDDLESQDQEVLWTQITTKKNKIYFGVYYGKQENQPVDKIENEYLQLRTQIQKLKKTGNVILTGDFNAKLRIKKTTIKQKQSRNGTHIKELLENCNLNPISVNAEEGLWTRQNRENPNEKSVIDYIITDEKMTLQCENVRIDEEGILRIKGKKESDHNTITLKANLEPTAKPKRIHTWNLENTKGWEDYNKVMTNLVNNNSPQTYNDLENTINQSLNSTKRINKG